MADHVVLVDSNDNTLGKEDKLIAHQKGLLHRAFSIFIFRKDPTDQLQWQLLLQRREQKKYHCAGLWSNTCCSHPGIDETVIDAGHRRLQEELGFTTPLTHVGAFTYYAQCDNNLIEYEYDHILIANVAQPDIQLNLEEISEIQWLSIADTKKNLSAQPQHYTPWFAKALDIALTAELLQS